MVITFPSLFVLYDLAAVTLQFFFYNNKVQCWYSVCQEICFHPTVLKHIFNFCIKRNAMFEKKIDKLQKNVCWCTDKSHMYKVQHVTQTSMKVSGKFAAMFLTVLHKTNINVIFPRDFPHHFPPRKGEQMLFYCSYVNLLIFLPLQWFNGTQLENKLHRLVILFN